MAKILVVDDAPTIIKIVTFALTEEGHEVESASNATEAVERVEMTRYDVGVFDVNMPGKNGIELTRDVLTMPNGREMKILILTTESSEELKSAGKEAGARGWLVKPFDNDDLVSIIQKLAG